MKKAVGAVWTVFILGGQTVAGEAVRLEERFPAGYRYHVSSRVDLEGKLTVPPMNGEKESKELAVSGDSAVEYDERVLDGDAGGPVQKTLRLYRRLDFRRKVGEDPQENTLRPAVRRLVLQRLKQSEVPFSPDGPLKWGEIDLVRTDVFTPALRGLLAGKEVQVGDHWEASRDAVVELTDLEELRDGKVDCKLQEIAVQNGRRYARIGFSGSVAGVNQDGPNRQQLDGYFFFDLQSNHLSYLYLHGVSWMLDKDGKSLGKIEGKFVLTRRLAPDVPELADDAIRGVKLEPNDDNTLLLFQEPALGVEFTYPRRWTVRQADARQITLDEPKGSGLLITLEPVAQTPTVGQFQEEILRWLQKQSGRILRTEPARRLTATTGDLDHFAFEAELDKKKVLLDYYVARQNSGGATFAGRLEMNEAAALQKDIEHLARSLKLNPPK